jgi:hypothetical protein
MKKLLMIAIGLAALAYSGIAGADTIDITSTLTGEVYDTSDGVMITSRNIVSAYYLNESFSAYGFIKFDLSSVPDDAILTAITLTTYHYRNPGFPKSPYNNPTVNIMYSSDDSWVRGATTDLSLLGEILSNGNTGFPTGDKVPYVWTLDTNAHDWSSDLSDNFLTLVLGLVESDYRFVYFYGSGETDPTKLAYDPDGTYAPVLHIEYELPPPALVGYWNFDEGEGVEAGDSSGYENDGDVIGTQDWVLGQCGSALSFDAGADGSIDYVLVPNSESINTSTFTVSLWVSISDLDESMVFLHKRNGQWYRNFQLSYNANNDEPTPGEPKDYLRIKIDDNGTPTPSNDFDNAAFKEVNLEPDRYYYVAGTYDQEKLKLYLDGIQIAEHSITMTDNVGGGDLYIGTHSADYLTMNPTHGIIDEVRIYNYALTQEEIQADMEACVNDTDGDGVPDDQDACVDSNLNPTVVIDGCDSGVPNILFDDGCTISDNIAELARSATNHGKCASAVSHYTNDLKKDGVISGKQKGAIQSCVGQADDDKKKKKK